MHTPGAPQDKSARKTNAGSVRPGPATAPAVRFQRAGFAYPGASGGIRALEAVTLDIMPGERVGVLGPNGGGKTTLLKLAMGLLSPTEGKVEVFGDFPERARRERWIAAVLQRCEAERGFPLSVRQLVTMGAQVGDPPWRSSRAHRQAVDRALALTGADAYADRRVGALSGGQLQRALIARAVAAGPRILALDEPTVGVDIDGQRQFAAMLDRLHAELGLTILLVSHDVRAVAAGCDRIVCVSRKVHYHDAPAGLTPQVLAEVFSHEVAAAFGPVHVHAHPAEDCDAPDCCGDAGGCP